MIRSKQWWWAWGVWVAAGSAALAAPPVELFQEVVASGPAVGPSRREVLRERLVGINPEALSLAEVVPGVVLRVALFDGEQVDVVLDHLDHSALPTRSWVGHVAGEPHRAVFLSSRDEAVALDFDLDAGGSYALEHRGAGLHALVEVDEALLPACGVDPGQHPWLAPVAPPVAAVGLNDAPVAADSPDNVDVLVGYTPAARTAAGGAAAIEASIANAIVRANTTYQNSGITLRLRRVHTYEVAYHDTNALTTDLQRWQGLNDGFMDEVHTLRNLHAADMCALLVDNPDGQASGIAFLMSPPSPSFSSQAFSVTALSVISNETFTHELGHNMGCMHARGDTPGSGSFSFSFGHRFTGNDGIDYRTVMAYAPGTRIQHFSNPDVLFQGVPTGVAVGLPTEAHNTLTINNNAGVISAWRHQNDEFFRSISLAPNRNARVTGNNTGFGLDAGEPAHGPAAGGRSAWWHWAALANGDVTITTAGSNYDTMLAVYTGATMNALVPVASNDDIVTGTLTSSVTFPGTAGTLYRIAVDGKAAASGSTVLAVVQQGTPAIGLAPNTFSESIYQNSTLGPRYLFVSNAAVGSLNYTLTDNASWLSVSPAVGSATHENDLITLSLSPASLPPGLHTATITVNGTGASNTPTLGTFSLTVIPNADMFSNPVVVAGNSGTAAALSTLGCTTQSGEPTTVAGVASQATVWYRWTASHTGTATFSTAGSSYDTVLAAYTGTAVDALTQRAANDNAPATTTSSVTFNTTAGQTYQIQIGGKNGASGTVSLSRSFAFFNGDANGDGVVNVADVTAIRNNLAGLVATPLVGDADFNNSGQVTIEDADQLAASIANAP